METKRKLTSNNIDFKTKTVVRDKGEHYIMIKKSIQQEDITFVNVHPSQKHINI